MQPGLGLALTERVVPVDGRTIAVRAVGLACCAVEVADGMAALSTPSEMASEAGEPAAHVLVVAGTVSHGLVDRLVDLWRHTPEPRAVVAYGACTISGGPYWDSYSVLNGLPADLAPAIQVPGCPPRPDVLDAAIVAAARLVAD
jgi:NADH-quinone oxidoreductase subunit B